MLLLQNIAFSHPGQELLFENLSLAVDRHTKIALVGNNGTGKSTLLKIIAGILSPNSGEMELPSPPYYVPQVFGSFDHLSVAQALQIDQKLNALQEILKGNMTEKYIDLLNEDWTVEERCQQALAYWQLPRDILYQQMDNLSGGQKSKVFLAGIMMHQPDLVLLDEPGNHLDSTGRMLLYNFIDSFQGTMLMVSHDRALLNRFDQIAELSREGIEMYGGNYDFYHEQKLLEQQSLYQHLRDKEKELRKAKEKARESMERKQKADAKGRKKQIQAGLPTIVMNTFRNNAEKSAAKLKDIHEQKTRGISSDLQSLRDQLPETDQMRFNFEDTHLHSGKILFKGTGLNFSYGERNVWNNPLNLEIRSGERIAIKGNNGSGKTTLVKIITGALFPSEGTVYRDDSKIIYVDQEYSLLNGELTVYEQAVQYSEGALQEHEIKIMLTRFLFGKDDWDKKCYSLSGGECMRLILCCLTLGKKPPAMIILDEPTNNLDIRNIEILTNAINSYHGTLVVISHDSVFLEETGIAQTIYL